ncbi:hypothetical protein [Vulgatibacter incomptus]|uniref:Uncharacterized protein n=1 Tax=Vulgatibacter incomptus TaxID=1391653 RepID=A0A0K1PHJ3_9BACT|nr:hypothetical protein [Vulgatibacter incomptus]AKU92990.1 hypothetical protein AKJ08_3377 [Vulgatibacter incomptus]
MTHELAETLEATRAALARGDALEASHFASLAWEHCEALQASGSSIPADRVAEASALVSACIEAAQPLRDELRLELERAGASSRAHAAYAR